MTHYRQIIINMAVEDDMPDEELEALAKKVRETVNQETKDDESVREISVRLN